MRTRILLVAGAVFFGVTAAALAGAAFHEVKAHKYDPGKTRLVAAQWVEGIGCPTGATTFNGTTKATYTDPACLTGDPRDSGREAHNRGLLLAKTGPTTNNASATAELKDVPSFVTELGYDIRKGGAPASAIGSHCGAGAPRFDIVTSSGAVYFIGCNSPPGTPTTSSTGWTRLRWGASTQAFPAAGGATVALSSLHVKSIEIVFDEGQDIAPDFLGAAVLDNIDVNGTLVGR